MIVASASQKGILCTIKDAGEGGLAGEVVGDGFGGEGEGVAVGIEGVGVDGEKSPAF